MIKVASWHENIIFKYMSISTFAVLWKNMEYTVTGCTLKFDRKGGNWYYLLELLDKRAGHSVMVVPMEDVTIAEKSTETAQI